MTFTEYAALGGLNWSRLRPILTSPAHYRAALDTPRADSSAMMIGRLVHSYVLEPDTEHTEAVFDGQGISGATAAGKAIWHAWLASRGLDTGLTRVSVPHLTPADLDTARRCRDAVWAHPAARAVLEGARTEVTLQTEDGRKGRLDILRPGEAVWDLKTARAGKLDHWPRTCAAMLYYEQLAFYSRLADVQAAGIIAVETTAPHDVLVMRVGDATMARARERVEEALETLRRCEASDEWPGRYPEAVTLDAPGWYFPDVDSDVDLDNLEDDSHE